MSTAQYWVGIDVSKNRLDINVRPSGESFQISNCPVGVEQLLEIIKPLAPQLVVFEATGGLESLATVALSRAGLAVTVVNPR